MHSFIRVLTTFGGRKHIRKEVEEKIKHNAKEFRGVEIFREKSDYDAPAFVQVGYTMIPVGGGKTTSSEIVASAHISADNKDSLRDFETVEADIKATRTFTGYINDYRHLEKVCNYYRLDTNTIPARFPLLIDKYQYKGGIYWYNDSKISMIALNKNNLMKEVIWHKRLPLTITIPTVAGLCIVAGWVRYYMFENRYYSSYYPPYHYKRISKYFNSK